MGLGEGRVTAENAVGSPGKVGGKPYFGGKNQMKNKVRFFMWGTGRRKIQDVAVAPRRRRVSRNSFFPCVSVTATYVAPRRRRVCRGFCNTR